MHGIAGGNLDIRWNRYYYTLNPTLLIFPGSQSPKHQFEESFGVEQERGGDRRDGEGGREQLSGSEFQAGELGLHLLPLTLESTLLRRSYTRKLYSSPVAPGSAARGTRN